MGNSKSKFDMVGEANMREVTFGNEVDHFVLDVLTNQYLN
jgi:hypothetical protein